jgi:hypothetical protein
MKNQRQIVPIKTSAGNYCYSATTEPPVPLIRLNSHKKENKKLLSCNYQGLSLLSCTFCRSNRMTIKHSLTVALFAAMTSPMLLAQQLTAPEDKQWQVNFHIANQQLDKKTSKIAGVDDAAAQYSVSFDYNVTAWKTSFAAGYVKYKDKFGFSQQVEGTGWSNKGDISTKGSSASALLLSASFGPQWYLGTEQQFNLYLQGGFGHLARSERSIPSCDDCYKEDIKLDAGLFTDAGANYSFGNWHTGLTYRHYLSGDFDPALGALVGFKF